MDTSAIDRMLDGTLEDRRMSRSERRALQEVPGDLAPDGPQRAVLRARVFDAARRAVGGRSARGSPRRGRRGAAHPGEID